MKIDDAFEGATLEPLLGQFGEEALDGVEPGCGGRGEVEMEPRVPFEPGANFEEGYRFIWRRPDNTLQGARGQARIPSFAVARSLMAEAEKAGWGDFDADTDDGRFKESEAA